MKRKWRFSVETYHIITLETYEDAKFPLSVMLNNRRNVTQLLVRMKCNNHFYTSRAYSS